MNKGILFVISSPSGGGKSTILKQVLNRIAGLEFSVSHTTRQPRPGEQDGREYHFISREGFAAIRDEQPCGFLEWAEVHGNFYGTSLAAVEAARAKGIDVILDIDVQGARQVVERMECVTVFIAPPSMAELERRLRSRGTESEQALTTRLANAAEEMAAIGEYQYLLINDRLDDAILSMQAVVIAERARRRRDVAGQPVQVAD